MQASVFYFKCSILSWCLLVRYLGAIFFELNFSEASVREDRRFIYLINHFNNIRYEFRKL
nr:MAG TPA: hypothetical protein [Caudoviricetes sp.]